MNIYKLNMSPLRILVLLLMLCSSQSKAQHPTSTPINCSQCHTCTTPTEKEMCLVPCARLSQPHATSIHTLKDAPGTFVIQHIANLFDPVTFNHQLHAEMATMGNDCSTCHHYNPEGRIPPCSECHGNQKTSANQTGAKVRQLSLKGAYHRQCLSCHHDWSNETQCSICHLDKAPPFSTIPKDSAPSIRTSSVQISIPAKKVYTTPYKKGNIVTFYHDQHTKLFGLTCVDCHKQESCRYCHESKAEKKIKKTDKEIHATCIDCHKTEGCSKCHDTVEKPRFTHAAIGLQLDEDHSDHECSECHRGNNFSQRPLCLECHDAGEVHYKKTPPGVYLKK